ncbi:MAG: 50S ribosomal protein L25 [Acidobacteria bacterium]|nr:MAG: 50S ribosomal protein L25 [Acidobacteriota bacterium]
MANTVVQATVREAVGKNKNRRLRSSGRIPGVVYGRGITPVSVSVDPRDIHRILHSGSGRNTIFKLDIDGTSRDVLIRDLQLDPLKDTLVHADFQAIAMDQAMVFEVPVEALGSAKGVKTGGGLLEIVMRTIEVECLPGDVPEHIQIDVSDMDIGDTQRVSQLKVDASKIKILNDPDLVVLSVVLPAAEKVEEVAVPTEEATSEPEVIKKGKAEEEEAAKE